jgi:hypothetical protein
MITSAARRSPAALLLLVTALLLIPLAQPVARAAEPWRPGTPPLSTPWTSQVGPANALPEYPRPQLTRPDWQNLNGVWEWAPAAAGEQPPIGRALDRSILVPYPVESALSGVQEHHDRMWYRRAFTVPDSWSGRRVKLNFGAVDWQADVWVNGTRVGGHTGGYTEFSFDVTAQLRAGSNEIVIGVFDPTDAGGQPVGKQRLSPGGIFYTASSGVWQTVWLEPVATAHVTRLDITPDVPGGRVNVIVRATGGATATVAVSTAAGVVGTASGAPGTTISVPVPNARLWSPDDPFLYDLRVTLSGGDAVGGYFGMRSVGLGLVDGVLRPLLNGRFVFQMGTLDQGFWPDGLHTAPTDAALRFDVQAHKDLGYNTIRKHVKVEPARWYHWADRLGVLVWQDMPSMTTTRAPDAAARSNFESELRQVVDQLRSTTSVVQWVPFNEGWGAYEPARIADLVKGWDPTRLVNNNSGRNCCGNVDGGNGDLVDDHAYVGPGDTVRPTATRAAVLGEYGGLGLRVAGHEWSPGNGGSYEMEPDGPSLENRYLGLLSQVQRLITTNGLSAAIYTEIADVENEVNGLYTYDRAVLKVNGTRLRDAHRALLSGTPVHGRTAVPVGELRSLQVTTPGFTDRYARHQDGRGLTEHVDSASSALLKADATWRLVPGLADSSCTSFESRNFPGEYLRHRDWAVHRERDDGSALLRQDATWCARPGLTGSDVSFESLNHPGRFLRHVDARLWLADNGGGAPQHAPAFYGQDVTWRLAPPWAP